MENLKENIKNNLYNTHAQGHALLDIDLSELFRQQQEYIKDLEEELYNLREDYDVVYSDREDLELKLETYEQTEKEQIDS